MFDKKRTTLQEDVTLPEIVEKTSKHSALVREKSLVTTILMFSEFWKKNSKLKEDYIKALGDFV